MTPPMSATRIKPKSAIVATTVGIALILSGCTTTPGRSTKSSLILFQDVPNVTVVDKGAIVSWLVTGDSNGDPINWTAVHWGYAPGQTAKDYPEVAYPPLGRVNPGTGSLEVNGIVATVASGFQGTIKPDKCGTVYLRARAVVNSRLVYSDERRMDVVNCPSVAPSTETPLLSPRGRWASNNLTVNIGPEPYAWRGAVQAALSQWEHATGDLIRLKSVKGDANITIRFVNSMSPQKAFDSLGGSETTTYDQVAKDRVLFRHAEIEILVGSGGVNFPFTWWDIVRIATHEVGHALGLDHSRSSNSVMVHENPEAKTPTDEDARPLIKVYTTPALPDLSVETSVREKCTASGGIWSSCIDVTVHNAGYVPASGSLVIFVDGQEILRREISDLEPGGAKDYSWALPPSENIRSLEVAAEPPFGQPEYDMANNWAEVRIVPAP